jgi:hypothetical protein
MATWIVRNSDSAWMVQGFGDPSLIHSQPASYSAVEVPGTAAPDPRATRYDAAAQSKIRLATAQEMTAYDETIADARADVDYRDKDVLAMVAVILEKTDSAFNTTDTNAQQRTKVVAAAVRFNQRRKWVERNYALMAF